jgi:hypothetical protein
MNSNNIKFTVTVNDRAVREYTHRGQTFIEGRAGSDYQLEVKNDNGFRVEAVVSVDGLSVIDGKAAGIQSSGYLIDAYSSIVIPGWKLNGEQAAKFAFTEKAKGNSYEKQSTGSDQNNGVIGIIVFKEKLKPVHFTTTYSAPRGISSDKYCGGGWTTGGIVASGSPVGSASIMSADALSPFNIGTYYNGNGGTTCSLNSASLNADADQPVYAEASLNSVQLNTLGTEFGSATDFSTTEVAFERGDMVTTMVLYYDEIKGLKSRGVRIDPPQKVAPALPQAFPAMQTGCTPPDGWKG